MEKQLRLITKNPVPETSCPAFIDLIANEAFLLKAVVDKIQVDQCGDGGHLGRCGCIKIKVFF